MKGVFGPFDRKVARESEAGVRYLRTIRYIITNNPCRLCGKGIERSWKTLCREIFQLYNLSFDVNEMTDLKYSFPVKTEEMKKVLKEWQQKTDAAMPVPNPEFDPDRRYEWGKHSDRR